MTMLKSIRNKSTVAINKLAPGESMLIPVDKHDTPLDYDWRRALKSAEIDNSVELSDGLDPENVPVFETKVKSKGGK